MLFAPFGPGCWLGVAKLLPEIVHWRRFLIKARIILSVRCFGLVFGSFVSFRHLLVSHPELILTQCLASCLAKPLYEHTCRVEPRAKYVPFRLAVFDTATTFAAGEKLEIVSAF